MNKKIIISIIVAAVIIVVGVVWGVLQTPQNQGNQPQNTNQPIVENGDNVNVNVPVSENGEEVDTSDWQTYSNEKLGFEVKYPESLEYQAELVDFYGQNKIFNGLFLPSIMPEGTRGPAVTISIFEKKERQDIFSFVKEISDFAELVNGKQVKSLPNIEAYNFDQVDAELVNLSDAVFVEGDNYIFLFDNEGYEFYEEIVSSFRFR